MPVYAFTCEDCGPFDVMRPMDEAAAAASCPSCGIRARRVFTPPGLALMARPLRGALDAEEKSAHEPDVVSEKRGSPMRHEHAPSPPWVLSH